ncbi:MAG: hypothetical protein Kow00129_05070 [Thermoleophilia bacterium]
MEVLNRGLNFVEAFIASTTLAVASVLVFTNVVMRYVFHDALPWAEELVRYALIWSSFIGASIAMRHGLHIGVEIVVDNLPGRLRKVFILIGMLIVLLYCVLVSAYGYQFIWEAYERYVAGTGRVASTTKIPFFYIQASVPVGVTLMGLRQLQILVNFWRGEDHPFEKDEQPGPESEHYHEAYDEDGAVLQTEARPDDPYVEESESSSLFDDPAKRRTTDEDEEGDAR